MRISHMPRSTLSPTAHRNSAPNPSRRQRRSAEIRDRLFRAALNLFAKKGFAETTVEDITEAADVGKGTFFNYFPSHDHIRSCRHDGHATASPWLAHADDSDGPGAGRNSQRLPSFRDRTGFPADHFWHAFDVVALRRRHLARANRYRIQRALDRLGAA